MQRVSVVAGTARRVATCLALGSLGLAWGCGAVESGVDLGASNAGAGPTEQARIPSRIQHRGELRYFFANGTAVGPGMVLFEDPSAPRVVSLTHPEGSYRAGASSWSPNGRTFAYQLFSEVSGITPYHFMLSDLSHGFEPQAVEHEALSERAYFLEWIGDRAIAVQTGVYHNEFDDYGWTGHTLWIDSQLGSVTDLGQLAASSVDSPRFGVLSALDASEAHLWASRSGLVYLDDSCQLSFVAEPSKKQALLQDCSAVAAWSGDGSFLVVTTAFARQLYQHVAGRLERWAFPALDSLSPVAEWTWAPSAPKFSVASVTGDSSNRLLSTLAFGDARTRAIASVSELPSLYSVRFVTDDLAAGMQPGDAKGGYLLGLTEIQADAQVQLAPITERSSAIYWAVASADSQRLYFPDHPFAETTLEAGRPSQSNTLFSETHPVHSVLFRLLNDDQVGLLTTIEPEQTPPGGDYYSAFERDHQYVLDLGAERAIVPLGTFDLALRSGTTGLRTWASAPQLGGVLYLGDSEHGGFVDWIGFDDITHRVRLIEPAGCCLIDLPPVLGNVETGQ